MYKPKSLLGWSNYLLFQWFWFRVGRTTDKQYVLTYWIWPTTGWSKDYKYVGDRRFFRG